MNWLDEMERVDKAYRVAYQEWCCPSGCGTVLTEHGDGMWCGLCGVPVSWAQLKAADTDD